VRRRERTAVLGAVAVAAVGFVATLAAFPAVTVSEYRAPRSLVAAAGANRPDDEVRHACYAYYQPSLVFYGQRELDKLSEDAVRPYLVTCPLPELVADSHKAREALECRLPVYLFLPGPVWDRLRPFVAAPHRELARRYDLYARCEIVVVTNR
jgi:hypothetical protein